MPTIRLATTDDAGQIQRIYAPFCRGDSRVSFEVEPPTVEEMRRRIAAILERHPWLVCIDGGNVLGYAYGSIHSDRAAYSWSVNVSVYIAEGHRGSGIGQALCTTLFALLKLQGYVSAYGGTTLPNPASEGLLKALGFEPVGVYQGVGFKCGAWQDVSWWQRSLGDRPESPRPPLTLAEARILPGWEPAMEAGVPLLRSK
jgi:L-amino acid N-acyltransferase YncA